MAKTQQKQATQTGREGQEIPRLSEMDDLADAGVVAGQEVSICGYGSGRVTHIVRDTEGRVQRFGALIKGEAYQFERGVCDYIMQKHTEEEQRSVAF